MAPLDEQETRRPRRWLALFVWSIVAITTWGLAWLIYIYMVELGTCGLGTAHGGRAHSEGWAGFIGLLLLVPVAILAFRRRRMLVLLFATFVTAYAAGLLTLWAVSPAIWGHVRCTMAHSDASSKTATPTRYPASPSATVE